MSDHLDPAILADFDALAGKGRTEALAHLERCAVCRAELAAHDPSALFSLLALRPIPNEILDEVSGSVREAVAPRRGTRFPLRWAGLAAAVAVSALALTLFVPGDSSDGMADNGLADSGLAMEAMAHSERLEVTVDGDDVDVMDLTVGDTQLVMVIDKGLEL